ncbi:phosphoribosylglycinamide formyltransferase [Agaribacter marinus]|uniref:Phosphoribosylglycinamide formyltransferase n=1 Tax=Agaribacter marinus TaxID=1431249 RepID=A0AA37WHC4_9ALTE|nr:phosphoribosylglycinamide formyltransferase [Agaribacter marinus]GLR69948.1 phosphoribosylglycinamide formyltransferase [Agaribacter marinus]
MQNKRIVILVSGNGSNAQAIIEACQSNDIRGEVCAIISNRPTAFALQRAKKADIDAITIDHKAYDSRESFDHALQNKIDAYCPDIIVLAGFMRILTPGLVKHYHGKMLNIHPSLLPLYPGLNTHQRAIDNGDIKHGASIHFVTCELDGGPIIAQTEVSISPDDTSESLAKKVAQREWDIYPLVIAWYCSGRLRLEDDSVIFDDEKLSRNGLLHNEVTF